MRLRKVGVPLRVLFSYCMNGIYSCCQSSCSVPSEYPRRYFNLQWLQWYCVIYKTYVAGRRNLFFFFFFFFFFFPLFLITCTWSWWGRESIKKTIRQTYISNQRSGLQFKSKKKKKKKNSKPKTEQVQRPTEKRH